MKISRKVPQKTTRTRRRRLPKSTTLGTVPGSGHLRMIVDPCNAPLVPGVYQNSLPALRARYKKVSLESHTPASTAGSYAYLVAYHPVFGAFIGFDTTASTNTWHLTTKSILWTPYSALWPASAAASTAMRSLGACLSMSWAGPELDRKGHIHSGIVPGSVVWEGLRTTSGGEGAAFTPLQVISQLANTCRTPNDKCELVWVPTEADAEYRESVGVAATDTGLGQAYARTNFVVMVYTVAQGVGETASLDIRGVSIVETNPDTAGIVLDAAHVPPTPPAQTVTTLVRHLQTKDPSWYVDSFKKMASLIGRGVSAYASGGVLGLVSEVAGLTVSSRKNFSS